MHLIFLVTAALLVPKLAWSAPSRPSQEQIIIPDTTLADDGHLGGIPNPGMSEDPSRSANQENQPNTNDAHGWAQRTSQSLSQELAAPAAQSSDIISSGSLSERGNGKDNSALGHLGGDGGGGVANFGPRGGGQGIGPKSRIFGSGGNVHRIIYVCDGSGSMLSGKDDILKRELKTAVANLAPVQSFNAIFFQDNSANGAHFTANGADLQMALPKNKTALYGYLDHLEFRNGTNPLPAMTEAIREKPELIYLLTDGEFDNPDSAVVLSKIDAMNKDKKVRINTVLLLQSKAKEDSNESFEAIMTKIAQDNGGTYKKYYADDW